MWSTIRTVLAILNVLGAIVFVTLAALDYGKRQSWSYQVFLHDVAVNGLPLDKDEANAEGQKIADLFGEQGKKDAFDNQPGPVATQLEEVDTYKKKLDGALSVSTDKRSRLVTLARILTPLAGSNDRRERLAAVVTHLADEKSADQLKEDVKRAAVAAKDERRKPAKPFDVAFAEEMQQLKGVSRKPFVEAYLAEQKKAGANQAPDAVYEAALGQMQQGLQADYDAAFEAALTGRASAAGGQSQEVSREQRKEIIASLLFNLTEPVMEIDNRQAYPPGTAWDISQGPYRRYLTVVGLEAAVKAVRRQALVLERIANEQKLEMDRERSAFIAAHGTLTNQLQQEATAVVGLREALARTMVLLADQQKLIGRRQQDIKLFNAELEKLNAEAKARLDEVRGMNDELYKVRVATRNASEANQQSERKIRTLEEGR